MSRTGAKCLMEQAFPQDLERAYRARDGAFIRARVHELTVDLSVDQDGEDFHALLYQLYVAMGMYDSLNSGVFTTFMNDYLNV